VGAYALGAWVLALVFGPGYQAAYPFVLAGFGFAVLCFVDQLVQLVITAQNRPLLLALKWFVACVVAAAVMVLGFAFWGAMAGPIGLACGLAAGWLALGATVFLKARS
jgi:O-antigen/teichoic acid export membrane protein